MKSIFHGDSKEAFHSISKKVEEASMVSVSCTDKAEMHLEEQMFNCTKI